MLSRGQKERFTLSLTDLDNLPEADLLADGDSPETLATWVVLRYQDIDRVVLKRVS